MQNKPLKEVTIFFIITIFLSFFVFWGPIAFFKIPAASLNKGSFGPIWSIMLFIIGGFVPSLTGIILTAVFEGKKQAKQLLKKAFQVKIGLKWFIVIILICSYFAVTWTLLYSVTGEQFNYYQFIVQLPTILPLIILGPLSEEYGWRGFALTRLLKFVSPNVASLVVGLVWSFWHLPLFYMIGTSQHDTQFFTFMIPVIGSSFIYTYIYIKTNQSLFSAVFFHWTNTYVMQVVITTIKKTNLYNWMALIPALLIGLLFVYLLHRERIATLRLNNTPTTNDSLAV